MELKKVVDCTHLVTFGSEETHPRCTAFNQRFYYHDPNCTNACPFYNPQEKP